MSTSFDAFLTAWDHHKAGRLPEAEALYRQVLETFPNHADSLHLLGLIMHQRGQHVVAEELIGRAIAGKGDQAAFHSNLGEVYRVQGKLAEAEQALRRALELDASSATAHNNLGIVLRAQGKPGDAGDAFRKAISLRGTFAEPLNNLGTVLQEQGELDEAISRYRQAIELNRDYVAAYNNLGAALRARGRLDDAAGAYRQAIMRAPENADSHLNLGGVFQDQGQLDAAVGCYREAVRLDPRSAAAHVHLAAALEQLGRSGEAIASCREALLLDPESADAHSSLGVALHATGDVAAAADAYRQALKGDPRHAGALTRLGKLLEEQGGYEEALAHYEQAIAADPQFGLAHVYRADVQKTLGRFSDAVASYESAIAAEPHNPEAYNNLAMLFNSLAQPDRAVECCQKGLEQLPDSAALHGNLATALGHQGRMAEAITTARQAVALRPESPSEFSNLLYGLNHVPGYNPATLFEEHLEWARRHAEPLSAVAPPHANDRTPDRKLRVGYVSPYFREHAVNFFTEPLITSHDSSRFEVYCYSDVRVPDGATRRLQAAVDVWRGVRGLDDEQLAAQIRADAVDVLVDLTGHIAANRLLVFARKPAPVQVTYIGYQNTTGMSAMDYRLTDERADPPGETDRYYTEKLVRLPGAFFCYRPAGEAPDVAPLPAQASGQVTFASFNNFTKVAPQTTRAWLDILQRVPGSRLLVLAYRGGYLQRHLHELARRRGMEPARIELFDKRPRDQYYELVARADIALDPFPFNGHTTTCDAIWLGVPVVMLLGQVYASRFGASVLANVGLDELIAGSVEEYVEMAVALAGDLDRLAEMRAGLRPRMAESILLDSEGFARKVEAAYRQMWTDWCQGPTGPG